MIVGDKDELIIEMPSVYNWLDINEQLNKQIPCCVCWNRYCNGLHTYHRGCIECASQGFK